MRKDRLEKVLIVHQFGNSPAIRIGRAVSGIVEGLSIGGIGVGVIESLGGGNLIANLGTLGVGAVVGAVYEVKAHDRENALIDYLTSSTPQGSEKL